MTILTNHDISSITEQIHRIDRYPTPNAIVQQQIILANNRLLHG
jgi:hypothetical protein